MTSCGGPLVVDTACGIVVDPEVALFGFAMTWAEVADGRFVCLEVVTTENFGFYGIVYDGETVCDGGVPAVEGLSREEDLVANFQDAFGPVLGHVVAVFADDEVGGEARSAEGARDGGGWHGGLERW